MIRRHNGLGLALAAPLVMLAALAMAPAARAADNYTVKDGTGATLTFCSKMVSGLQHPCHLLYGLIDGSGAPRGVAVDADGNVKVAPQGVTPVSASALPLPAGAATAANQATANASLSSIDTKLTGAATAAAQATGNSSLSSIDGKLSSQATAANQAAGNTTLSSIATKLDQLHSDATAATPAGENHVGQVGGYTFTAGATFTRPASAQSDVSGDILCASTTAGSCAPMQFTVARVNAGTGSVRRARIKTTDTAYLNASVKLHLYKNSPTPTNGDSGPWLTTESLEFCVIDVTLNRHFSDAEKGIGAPTSSEGAECSFDTAAGSQVVYGYVEARSTVTSGSAKTWTVVLEGFGD